MSTDDLRSLEAGWDIVSPRWILSFTTTNDARPSFIVFSGDPTVPAMLHLGMGERRAVSTTNNQTKQHNLTPRDVFSESFHAVGGGDCSFCASGWQDSDANASVTNVVEQNVAHCTTSHVFGEHADPQPA